MKTSDSPIVIQKTYNSDSISLWKAMTDFKEMKQWYFSDIYQFEPTVGSETKFVVTVENRTYTHIWNITEVVPQESITYTWQYAEHKGLSSTKFKITEIDNGVLLTLTILIHEDFPTDIPEFKIESCLAGWEYFLGHRLQEYLHGN